MQQAGLKWVRTGTQFEGQGQPTSHEWIDRILSATAAHGIKVVLGVFGKPRNDLGSQADRQPYKQWLQELVHRVKNRVRVWEVGNEPNLPQFWNIRGRPGDASWNDGVHRYAQHLADTYDTIKAEDSTATVLLGGLSQHGAVEYLERLVDDRVNGKPAYHYFDAVNIHPYGDTPDDVVAEVEAVQQRMASVPQLAEKPLWITEFGWQTSWKDYHRYVASEEIKAQYLVEAIRKLRAIGIETPIIVYVWRDDGFTRGDVGGEGSGFGLTTKRSEGFYLPAFYRLQSLIQPRPSPSPPSKQSGGLSFTGLPVTILMVIVGLGTVLLGMTFALRRRRRRSSLRND